jgi:lysophospholipase L1-like esterase
MLIEPNSNLLMIGDSITECERAYPIGEAINDGLGTGYVGLVNALLNAASPAHKIRVLNMGIGGNTVLDLEARWESDVLALQPDWLSVMIGINDVWQQFDNILRSKWGVPLTVYTATLEKLVAQTRPRVKGLVLMSPYFIEPNKTEPMRALMDTYGTAMRQIADAHQAIFVDTQAALDEILHFMHPMTLARDRIHLNQIGHAVLARAFLNAIEYQW